MLVKTIRYAINSIKLGRKIMKNKSKLQTTLFVCLMIGVLLGTSFIATVEAAPTEPPIEPPTLMTYTIRGFVRESGTVNPIGNAQVDIYRGSSLIRRVYTTSSGYFSTTYRTSLYILEFKAIVSASGYYPKTQYQEVVGTDCYFRYVYLNKIPMNTYTIQGNVVDYHEGCDVPGATVEVYGDSSFLGFATTNEVDGIFSYTYQTSSTISSFRILVRQEGYTDADITRTTSGTTCDFGDVVIQRGSYLTEITSCDFSYDGDKVFKEFWTLHTDNPEAEYELVEDVAVLSSWTSTGNPYKVYMSADLDLYGWTTSGDLPIRVRFRFHSSSLSDGAGTFDGTNILIGVGRPDQENDPFDPLEDDFLWQEPLTIDLSGIYDTGWVEETIVLPRASSSAEPGVGSRSLYNIVWGYSRDCPQLDGLTLFLDEFSVIGDGFPRIVNDRIVKNCAGVGTNPQEQQFVYGGTFDSDVVGVGYDTNFGNSIDPLGIYIGDFLDFESAITVGMDDDIWIGDTSDLPILRGWSIVDQVSIAATVEDSAGYKRGDVSISSATINADNGVVEPNPTHSSALGLALETIGLIPEVGSFIKYLGHVLLFSYEGSQYVNQNQYSEIENSDGFAQGSFDFGDGIIDGILPGGTTDFQMDVDFQVLNLDWDDVYTITIQYTITVKKVVATLITVYGQTWPYPIINQFVAYALADFETHVYSESMSLAYFQSGNREEIHYIEPLFGCSIQAYSGPSGETSIFDTVYGNTCKFVWLTGGASQIHVTAPIQDDNIVRIYEWSDGFPRLNPILLYGIEFILIIDSTYLRLDKTSMAN